ncbi:retrovirus-related pol polyprotein from transposon TNT 1-94 [Tanacetum coccineum]
MVSPDRSIHNTSVYPAGVASSSSVSRQEYKYSNLKKRVLIHTKSKSTSKDFKKYQSSVSLGSNKHNTLNSNVFESKTNVLKAKTVRAVNDGLNLICVSCGKGVFMISHDKCVARYTLSMNSRVKRALFTSPVAAKSSNLGATFVVAKSRKSRASVVIQLVLWIVDSGCSKHMIGNLKLLRNFIEKFMGTVCFDNDHFVAIIGYGDYVQGNLMICHVYYVEGLGHNLFSVGQFCDWDLDVAFRSNTCYVRNLEGEDLLTSSHHSNLYTISISEMAASSPVCLMSKATSTKSRSLCYPTNDRDDLGKMKPKADIGIFIGYSKSSRGFRIYNRRTRKILETIHVKFDELTTMASECNNSGPGLNCSNFQDLSEDSNDTSSKEDLDNLFGPLYEEYYETRSPEVSNNFAANTLNNEDTPSLSSIIVEEHEAP